MKFIAWVCAGVVLANCSPTENPALTRTGTVSGPIVIGDGLRGDVWAFLYKPHEGPPEAVGVPQSITAVSATRVAVDQRYVFGQVKPNPFRLWGLLDVDGNFDPSIDVLSQPTKGDQVASHAVDVNVQPGRGASAELLIDRPVKSDPPAFVLDTDQADVSLDATLGANSTLTLVSDSLGRFDAKRGGFEIGLVDANGDGVPDDANGDGTPDLSLTLFLRWLPRNGQRADGEILVPLLYNPAPFLSVLQNRLDTTVIADRLQTVVIATEQVVTDANGKQTITALSSPPPGSYELVALVPGGQFWRVPNQLGSTIASQNVQLHFDRRGP